MDIDPEKIDKVLNNPFFIGGVGSFIALRWSPGLTWLERLFNFGCGLAIAGFLAEPSTEILKLTSPAMLAGTAFLLGVFGMNLMAAINTWIREAKLSDLLPWVKRG